LFRATVTSNAGAIDNRTYYYWTLGDGVVPDADAPGTGNPPTITLSMDGTDPADQTDWNPPAFGANNPRKLTLTIKIPADKSAVSVHVILKNLCQPNTRQTMSWPIQTDMVSSSAAVPFPQITDPAIVSGLWTQYLNPNPMGGDPIAIPYHLEGRANSCSLFEATVEVLDDHGKIVGKPYYCYYWTMGDGINP
jgi:hypothetical protein